MAYIDDKVIATESVEHHMKRLKEAIECLHEAGFKMRVHEIGDQVSWQNCINGRYQT